jgi:hypothetical protein
MMTNADGTMVRSSLRAPFLKKVASANGKSIPAVGIANF